LGDALSAAVTVVADAAPSAGLGHLSRSTALAVALAADGIEVRCLGYGLGDPIERDGVDWQPLPDGGVELGAGDAIVFDSYEIRPVDAVARGDVPDRLIAFHDQGEPPARALLVVSIATETAPEVPGQTWLTGFEHACLRPPFWDPPERRVSDVVETVLVTAGAADTGAGAALAGVVREALPAARIAFVRGPFNDAGPPEDVDIVDAPDSLLEPLVGCDLVVCAAGQTMLEAAATGAPAVVAVVAPNQEAGARLLDKRGGAHLIDPADWDTVVSEVREIGGDLERRKRLSRSARAAVDGRGARRVAARVASLL